MNNGQKDLSSERMILYVPGQVFLCFYVFSVCDQSKLRVCWVLRPVAEKVA